MLNKVYVYIRSTLGLSFVIRLRLLHDLIETPNIFHHSILKCAQKSQFFVQFSNYI